MIRSFRHKGLAAFYRQGRKSGIRPSHARRLRLILAALETAQSVEDMRIPGFRLHPLSGRDRGRWSVTVNGNWRVTFRFRGGEAEEVDYEDYH